MIIDGFTQMGPGIKNRASAVLPPMRDTSTAAGLIAALDEAGIDRAVTFAPRWVGGSFLDPTYERANAAVFEATQQYPDRLIGYGRVNPNWGEAAQRELRRCFDEYGFKGVKLDPDWENFNPNDKKLVHPLMEIAAAHGAPVLFHSGFIPAQPALFWDLALAFPKVPIVLAHMSQRLTNDAVILAQRVPNIYLDTSDHMYMLGQYVRQLGVERFVFGSNLPFSTVGPELMKVRIRADLSEKDKSLILGGNLERIVTSARVGAAA
jgi:predicted TIM-barrel fold metal-dependent hydrolase